VHINLKVVLAACVILGFGHLAFASEGPGLSAGRSALVSTAQLTSVQIGESSIDIKIVDTGAEVTLIRVHQNEMPAGAVGTQINTEVPSRFIDLSQLGDRNITVTLSGHEYSFDPNRIYSTNVAPAVLGAGLSPAAVHAANELGDAITSRLLPNAPVVALHNNRGTLLESYASGPFKKCTKAVYVNPHMDASTFAVVSTRSLFDAIRNLGINVVWENRTGTNDDGSLLAYAQRHNIPYVNIEAAQGAPAAAQLTVVRQILPLLLTTARTAVATE
jgi:hypothetical protein